ncbi:MAG: MotE family protein [Janthinobacterium lividum]
MRHRFALPGLLVLLAGLGPTAQAAAPAAPSPTPVPATEAQRFCQNVAAAAADARFALQTRKLNDLQAGIAQRVAALEAKELEIKAVLALHEQAKKQAEAALVGIYAKMRPDAAAGQIAALDDAVAAAVLQGLNARQSSAILNEIPAERAVKLVGTIAGLVPPPAPPAPAAPPPEDSRS